MISLLHVITASLHLLSPSTSSLASLEGDGSLLSIDYYVSNNNGVDSLPCGSTPNVSCYDLELVLLQIVNTSSSSSSLMYHHIIHIVNGTYRPQRTPHPWDGNHTITIIGGNYGDDNSSNDRSIIDMTNSNGFLRLTGNFRLTIANLHLRNSRRGNVIVVHGNPKAAIDIGNGGVASLTIINTMFTNNSNEALSYNFVNVHVENINMVTFQQCQLCNHIVASLGNVYIVNANNVTITDTIWCNTTAYGVESPSALTIVASSHIVLSRVVVRYHYQFGDSGAVHISEMIADQNGRKTIIIDSSQFLHNNVTHVGTSAIINSAVLTISGFNITSIIITRSLFIGNQIYTRTGEKGVALHLASPSARMGVTLSLIIDSCHFVSNRITCRDGCAGAIYGEIDHSTLIRNTSIRLNGIVSSDGHTTFGGGLHLQCKGDGVPFKVASTMNNDVSEGIQCGGTIVDSVIQQNYIRMLPAQGTAAGYAIGAGLSLSFHSRPRSLNLTNIQVVNNNIIVGESEQTIVAAGSGIGITYDARSANVAPNPLHDGVFTVNGCSFISNEITISFKSTMLTSPTAYGSGLAVISGVVDGLIRGIPLVSVNNTLFRSNRITKDGPIEGGGLFIQVHESISLLLLRSFVPISYGYRVMK
jgi:hypothetical protein